MNKNIDLTLRSRLATIAQLPVLAVPESEPLPSQFESITIRNELGKFLPCQHILSEGSSNEEVEDIRVGLSLEVPTDLASLLAISNGAKLFCLEHHGGPLGVRLIPRYRLLTTLEIITVHREMSQTYLSYISDEIDDYLSQHSALDYVAFCDVGDGDYLALNLHREYVFLLDHDYGYFPSRLVTDPEYEPVANNIEDWLDLLLKSYGRDGMGSRFRPL